MEKRRTENRDQNVEPESPVDSDRPGMGYGERERGMQVLAELKARVEQADLWPESTNDDRCDNCAFYKAIKDGIGYCAHRDVDMVVGGPWWCKLWKADAAMAASRKG
jgi:hypothetical protein